MPGTLTLMRVAALVALGLAIAPAHAETLFKIRAGGCTLHPINRALAGFLLEGHEGIITALHGVADCAEITAESFNPQVVIAARVAHQDVRLDVAHLVPKDATDSEKLQSLSHALRPFKKAAQRGALKSGLAVVSLGFEAGVLTAQRNTRLAIGDPPMERLGDILGSGNSDIAKRGSPSVELSVIKLEGTVNKGESGGPVIIPSQADAVIGLVLGAPEPGLSNLAWVAPIDDIRWMSFDAAHWRTRHVPKALADAVGYDGPATTLWLELSHGKQSQRTARTFPIAFETELKGNIAHGVPFSADYGTTFENPIIEEIASLGVTRRDVTIAADGRSATFGLNLQSSSSSPKVGFRGTVTLDQVREISPRQVKLAVDFSTRASGAPYGERTIEARTEGTWTNFRLVDSSDRELASGAIEEPAPSWDGRKVLVRPMESNVTVRFVDPPPRPMPPPTIAVE